jgi:hypothetical protein
MYQIEKQDPDPHQIEKQDPDPYQSEKQESDPYQSEKQDPNPHQKGLDPQHWARYLFFSGINGIRFKH